MYKVGDVIEFTQYSKNAGKRAVVTEIVSSFRFRKEIGVNYAKRI